MKLKYEVITIKTKILLIASGLVMCVAFIILIGNKKETFIKVGVIDGRATINVPKKTNKHIYERGDSQTTQHSNIVWDLVTGDGLSNDNKLQFYEYAVVKDGGGISPKTLAKALVQADKDHLDVVNLSANFYVEDKGVKNAIEQLIHDKTTVVVSAGNIGSGKPQFPSNIKGVISVGSKHNNKISSFSPRQQVAKYADGENVKYKNHIVSGTSFSAPKITNQIIQEKIHNNANTR